MIWYYIFHGFYNKFLFPISNSVMLIFALMVFNALSITATIITISVLCMEPRPRMPDWLDRLVCKPRKVDVQKDPNPYLAESKIENVDAIHKSQRVPADIKKSSRCSGDAEQEQLNEKWRKAANIINKCLFLLFSLTFTILICNIFAVWIFRAKYASQVLSKSV